MIARIVKASAWTAGALFVVFFAWASQITVERSKVDCELQTQVKEELKELGLDFVSNHSDGSFRIELLSSAEYLGFYCRTICRDGSTGASCSPAHGERISARCRISKDMDICRHTLWVSGTYIDEKLEKRLNSRVLSRKLRLFER